MNEVSRACAGTTERLTLDTPLIHDYFKQRPRRSSIELLLALARDGAVDLAVTRYIHNDIPRPGALQRRLAELPLLRIRETGGVFTLDESVLGGPDGLGSQRIIDLQQTAVVQGWRPTKGKAPDSRDWMHIHAHFIQGRDVFLTWDQPLLELGRFLAQGGLEVRIVRPDVYLATRLR